MEQKSKAQQTNTHLSGEKILTETKKISIKKSAYFWMMLLQLLTKKMRFMGIYAKNREEWLVTSFGCQMDSITIVTLYDTLGMKSIEYIFNQTELSTIVMEGPRNLTLQ